MIQFQINKFFLLCVVFLVFIFIATPTVFGQEKFNIELLLNEGSNKIKLSEYERSIKFFDKVLEIDSYNIPALNYKGFALLNLEKNEDAILYFDRVLEIDSANIDALSKKGAALLRLEKDKEAIFYFDQVLELDSTNISVLSNKGVILAKLNEYDEAINYFDQVLQILPNDFGALRNKAMALIHLNEHQNAISIFDRLLQLNNESDNSIMSEEELIKKIDLASTKNSKYYVYLQVQVRNSNGDLIGFIESDNADYLPLSLTEKFVESYPLKKIISRNGDTFELRELTTTHHVEKFHPFGGQTRLYDPNTLDTIVYFSTLHHGFPVDTGDAVTITWNIMKKISN